MIELSSEIIAKIESIALQKGFDKHKISYSKSSESFYIFFYDSLKYRMSKANPFNAVCLKTNNVFQMRKSKDEFFSVRVSDHQTTNARNNIEIISNGKKVAVFYKREIV